MPVVPKYERSVRLDPLLQRGINVQSSPDDFGAAIGRGMGDLAAGVGRVAQAKVYIEELEGEAAAKDADNISAAQIRELTYGQNGFLNLEGQAAVAGRETYEKRVNEILAENGKTLTGFGGKAYKRASDARLGQTLDTSIRHQSSERKSWMKTSSAERTQTFADDALAGYTDPKIVARNIAAGQAEIASLSALQGENNLISERQADFAAGVHKNIVVRMAQLDPYAANEYAKKHKDALGDELADLEGILAPVIIEQKARGEAARIMAERRSGTEEAVSEITGTPSVGPTKANAGKSKGAHDNAMRVLQSRAIGGGTRLDAIVNLDKDFAINVAAIFEDAPAGIKEGLGFTSGYRSNSKQRELYADSGGDGSVASPGGSSHEFGLAMDITWNGKRIDDASTPANVVKYLHDNAAAYGLNFRLKDAAGAKEEDWHVEPVGARDRIAGGYTIGQAGTGVSARASGASAEDQAAQLDAIKNPLLREETARRLKIMSGQQDAAAAAQREQIKMNAFAYVDSGQSPDGMDPMLRAQLGREEMSGLWSYYESRSKGIPIETNDYAMSHLQQSFANRPEAFAKRDLFAYRSDLSDADWEKVNGWKQTALTDIRKAKEEGAAIVSVTDQMSTQLKAVGIDPTGLTGAAREAMFKREAAFQLALQSEINAYTKTEGKKPGATETQSMINRMLLPVVIKTDNLGPFNGEENVALFEVPNLGALGANRTAALFQDFAKIPALERNSIMMDLEQKLGYKPTEEQVEVQYAIYMQSQATQGY